MAEFQHTRGELAQMQSLPLDQKILLTKKRIREWYDHWNGEVYVSFSGGKDSTVLKHIVDSMYNDIPSLFINTGLEYPEIQKFAMSQKNVVTVRPKMRFDEVITKYGYPMISKEVAQQVYEAKVAAKNQGKPVRETNAYTRRFNPQSEHCLKNPSFCIAKWDYLFDAPFDISHMCCKVMKKSPAHDYEKQTAKKPILATLAEESVLRRTEWMKGGCNAFEAKRPRSLPMSFWTEQDVLHYIKRFNIAYCSVYGEIKAVNSPEATGQISLHELAEECKSEDVLTTTGCDRTGCVFCGFGCHREKEPNRFQMLKRTHPRQYEYCINGGEYVDGLWKPNRSGLGLAHVLDYLDIAY